MLCSCKADSNSSPKSKNGSKNDTVHDLDGLQQLTYTRDRFSGAARARPRNRAAREGIGHEVGPALSRRRCHSTTRAARGRRRRSCAARGRRRRSRAARGRRRIASSMARALSRTASMARALPSSARAFDDCGRRRHDAEAEGAAAAGTRRWSWRRREVNLGKNSPIPREDRRPWPSWPAATSAIVLQLK